MKYRTKARIVIVLTIVVFAVMAAVCNAAIDPNSMPFSPDPNAYTEPIVGYGDGDPNTPMVFETTVRNKGGWNVDLSIEMADGTPTSVSMQAETSKPIHDPNTGGFKKVFNWSWTPPAEGVYYLELRATTRGKPEWQAGTGTVILYCYGEDVPWIEMPDPPIVSIADKQRTFQVVQKFKHNPAVARILTMPGVAKFLLDNIVTDGEYFVYAGPTVWPTRLWR